MTTSPTFTHTPTGRRPAATTTTCGGGCAPDGGYYFSARGHLGQLITVFPKDRLVIVRFGRNENGVDSWCKGIETVAAKAR